jgi:flagellar basal-body rod protein FlgC
MSLFDALNISASGLTAQRLRMDVTSANLANAQTTRTPGGGPYRRQDVVLQEASGDGSFAGSLQGALGGGEPAGVEVAAIVPDTTPLRKVYEPDSPDADQAGYVTMPNVNPVTEMTDLIDASRSYQANVTAMQTTKSVFMKTIELL